LDVGNNKPFKCCVQARWEEWKINGIKVNGVMASWLQEDVSAWVAEVSLEMHGLGRGGEGYIIINYVIMI
jgi:hypothetical protein